MSSVSKIHIIDDDMQQLNSALRQQYLVEHLDQGIWDVDRQTKTLNVSRVWCEMRSMPVVDAVDLADGQWLNNIHPDDRAEMRWLVEGDLPVSSAAISIQYRYRLKSGRWLWILCRAKVMERDAQGQPTRLVGTDTMIDDVKRDAEVRAELMNKLQLALDASGIGIWEYSAATKRVYWDDQMLEIYGLQGQPNDQYHTIWSSLIHPDDREATIAYAEECQRSNSDFNRDYRIVRPDGEVRYLRGLARYVTCAEGYLKLIGVNIDITSDVERTQELEDAHNQLEYESRHDALTGLANRRLLDDAVNELAEGADPDLGYAILQMDLDHFKSINDTLGHAAGDEVLKMAARVLREKTSHLGLVCRTGGDEFVVLIHRAEPQEALAEICKDIVQAISQPFEKDGKTCVPSISIGVGYSEPGTTDHAATFRRADKALYSAKHAGRGRAEFYTRGKSFNATGFSDARQRILKALSKGEITCHYQPQYDVATLSIVGAEALVRWDCPERGLLAPDQFLPQVAETDVITHIDKHMLSLVLAQQTAWHEAGIAFPKISLNIAQDRILEPSLGDNLKKQVAPHHSLSFELLETAFVDAPDPLLMRNLAQLREMDIQIELDDFGSGHSSVVALQTIKPDRIKIDRGLVAPIVSCPDQILILNSLSQIARLVKAKIVVEGLETGHHLAAIRNVDCDVLQGFGLHKPVPPSRLTPLFVRHNFPANPHPSDPATGIASA